MKKTHNRRWLVVSIAICAFSAVLAAVVTPNFVRAQHRNAIGACKSTLKNLGTALEMYSTDNHGHYPTSFNQLTPNYLKTIPACPIYEDCPYGLKTGKGVGYNKADGFEDYYFLWCTSGEDHESSIPPGYPQYDGISGLIER